MILLTLQSSIYTDSTHAFKVVHETQEHFPNQMASLSLHHGKVAALFDAIPHPASMAACEHQAYANHSKRISAGNARAHAAAEAAA